MAQAFTATDPSVRINEDQWQEIPDLGREPHLHTDGCGTISRKLADMIWAALCKDRPHFRACKGSPDCVKRIHIFDCRIRANISCSTKFVFWYGSCIFTVVSAMTSYV